MSRRQYLVALLGLALAVALVDLSEGAVVHYRYGSSGSATTLTDVSGNGFHGTATGSTFLPNRPPNADLIPGVPLTAGALSVDGNNGSGGRSNANNLLSNAAIQTNGGFTMETWFYRTALNNSQSGFQKLLQLEVENFYIPYNSNQVRFSDGVNPTTLFGTIGIGEWHHVASVFDSGSNPLVGGTLAGNLDLYLDGTLAASQSLTLNTGRDLGNAPLHIGSANLPQESFNGQLFETRISLGALPLSELLLPSSVIPEPSSVVTWITLSLCGLFFTWRRRRRAA